MNSILNTFTVDLVSISNSRYFFTIEKSRLPPDSLLGSLSKTNNLIFLPFSNNVMRLIQEYFYISKNNSIYLKERIGWPDLLSSLNVIKIDDSDISHVKFYENFVNIFSDRDCPISITEETLTVIKRKMLENNKLELLPYVDNAHIITYTFIYMLSIYLNLDFQLSHMDKYVNPLKVEFEKDFTIFKNRSFISNIANKLDKYVICIVRHIKIHRNYHVLTTFKWNEMTTDDFNDLFKVKDRIIALFKFALNEYSLIRDLVYFKINLTNTQNLTLPHDKSYKNINRLFTFYDKIYVHAIYNLLLYLKDHEYIKENISQDFLRDFSDFFSYNFSEDWLLVDGFSKENLARIFN